MTDLLDKLSSYNLFNYLLPGVLFVFLGDAFTSFSLMPTDLIVAPFIYYFAGMVVSRIGSLILQPILKLTKFLIVAEYADYVKAANRDDAIATLSEQNNSYRTIATTFICLLALALLESIIDLLSIPKGAAVYILCVLATLLFLFAYRKQTSFITKRVAAALKPE